MRKVISIALFGNADDTHYGGTWYGEYLPAFVRAHLNLFPLAEDWKLVIHLNDEVAEKHRDFILRCGDAGLLSWSLQMRKSVHTHSMLWRLLPVFEYGVDYVFSRDLDHLPMPRDRAVCESFIRSKCVVHAAHDNVQHSNIPGGLCGFLAPEFRRATGWTSLDDLYKAAGDVDWKTHGTDQNVLNRLLLRHNGPKLLEHRYNGWKDGKPGLERRQAGQYACGGLSAVMPDIGISRLSPELTAEADRLAPFLGAAGYDHEAAVAFWKQHGDPDLERQIAECER